VCRTHSCEKVFVNSILGFVRGILSHRKLDWTQKGDRMVPFSQVIQFVEKFLNIEIEDDEMLYDTEKQKFLTTASIFTESRPSQDNVNALDREAVKSMLSIPSEYFLSRGFSKEVLIKYDVGDCKKPNKPMSHRAVVPIYDNDFNVMLGCTGRSIHNKCSHCSCYHSPSLRCPSSEYSFFYSKWKHSKGFKTDNSLYNYWYAQKHIKKSHCAVLVESPGNVWKLEMAGIHNSLAIYGASLSAKQKMLLDISGAMTLIILTDNDEAGQKCRDNIEKQCSKIYNVKHLYTTKNDVAEMSVEEIKDLFKEYI
jgi:5S rRNA maturation endonuclease (ribonuclease M5)